MHQHKVNLVHEGVKAAPAVGGTGYAIFGMPLSDVVAIATLIYVVLQIILIIPKIKDEWLSKKD